MSKQQRHRFWGNEQKPWNNPRVTSSLSSNRCGTNTNYSHSLPVNKRLTVLIHLGTQIISDTWIQRQSSIYSIEFTSSVWGDYFDLSQVIQGTINTQSKRPQITFCTWMKLNRLHNAKVSMDHIPCCSLLQKKMTNWNKWLTIWNI